jgi:uncharacterized membrane protein
VSSTPKRFWVILAVSVALNLFCIGLLAGRVMPFRQHHFGGDDENPRAFLRHSGLREAGPEVKAILRDHRDQVRGSVHALTQSRERVRAALKQEPFNREGVASAFAETRELTTRMQGDMHQALIDVAAKLTPAQRARMAESLWNHRKPSH